MYYANIIQLSNTSNGIFYKIYYYKVLDLYYKVNVLHQHLKQGNNLNNEGFIMNPWIFI